MKAELYANDMLRAIGGKEIQENFRNHLLSGFESYFPGAIEIVVDEDLEVYVNDIPLITDIINFIKEHHNVGDLMLGVNWVHDYAIQEDYVRQVIPFKVNKKQKEYICPENR